MPGMFAGLWCSQIFVCLLHTHGKHQMVAGHQFQEGKTQSLRSCCHWVLPYWHSSNLCFTSTPRVFSSFQIKCRSFQGTIRSTTDSHRHTGVCWFLPSWWCHTGDWCKGWTVQVWARILGGCCTALWHLRRHHDWSWPSALFHSDMIQPISKYHAQSRFDAIINT